MDNIPREDIKKLLTKYEFRLDSTNNSSFSEYVEDNQVLSQDYKQFKKENTAKALSRYEKGCAFCESILKISPDPKKAEIIQKDIDSCHLNVTPTGTASFSILVPLGIMVLGSIVTYFLFQSLFFPLFFAIVAAALINPLAKIPNFIASRWRMEASNQMVLCIFYVVAYMRHTSNLEKAVEFAADHLSPPLNFDLKKVLWDVETEKYESVKESLDMYLEGWKEYNKEFVETFHVVESSLYEGDQTKRVETLDKALNLILDETYEKMLHYAHDLRGPITMLHMLGVILPILGLVIMPLVVSFMEGVHWYHLATIYNVALPIGVYFMGRNILVTRPAGYKDSQIDEEDLDMQKSKKVPFKIGKDKIIMLSPFWMAFIFAAIFMTIGLSPLIMHAIGVPDIGIGVFDDDALAERVSCGKPYCLLEYRPSKADASIEVGPYGFGSSVLSLFFVLGLGVGIGLYFKLKTGDTILIREQTKKLEQEFSSTLFQLANRLGDGLPAEIAFMKVAEVMKDTPSGSFFKLVSSNISKLGMGVQDAIFDPKVGAINYFPSNLIESSMKVLLQSARKGPHTASQSLMNVSRYIKEIHKVNERLKDLMADVISSMKSQISFMTPAISGIVVGIASMITSIIGKIMIQMQEAASTGGGSGVGGLSNMFGDGIPTYYLQIIVGVYVIQIVYILIVLGNGIENGTDKVNEEYTIGRDLTKSVTLYFVITLIIMTLFTFIASNISSSVSA